MTSRTRTTLAVLTFSSLLAAAVVFAAEGKAEGTITVNGKTAKLTHAYARAVPGFFDKTKEDVEVILTDVALDDKALTDVFARIEAAGAGKLHAFEIRLDADGKPISTAFRDAGFRKVSPSGISSSDVFTKEVFDGTRVSGSYKSAGTHEFFGEHYAFDVSFTAEIVRATR